MWMLRGGVQRGRRPLCRETEGAPQKNTVRAGGWEEEPSVRFSMCFRPRVSETTVR